MKPNLKPLNQQVIVITGASSGIGLATAKAAAKAGAKVMLAARDGDALQTICTELRARGAECDFVETDVGDEDQVKALAARTVERFGSFDTWVNNAGVGVISPVENISTEDHHQLFRTNYWGVVYGSQQAAQHFRAHAKAGAIINVGSALSDIPEALNVAYSASKHAVKGFTDGLRIELQHDNLPVAVTLIKPSGVDSRFFENAKTNMDGMGKAPGPVYAPEVVADAILYAARHPKRAIAVGSTALLGGALNAVAPGLVQKQQENASYDAILERGRRPSGDNLYTPSEEGRIRGGRGDARSFSLTEMVQTHPKTSLGVLLFAGAAMAALAFNRTGRGRDSHEASHGQRRRIQMTRQIPLSDGALAYETRQGKLHQVEADLAYLRLGIVNVAFFGMPGAGDRQWVLIDAGIFGSAGRIKAAAAERFGTGARPAAIIMTHGHFDHVGALEQLAEEWDVPVYAHALELPYLNGSAAYPPPDPSVGGGLMARLSPLFPRTPVDLSHRLRPLPEDGTVPNMPGWQWVHTPGHTIGHISLWRQTGRSLIAGDAFITTGQESAYEVAVQEPEMHGPPAYFTPDWAAAGESVRFLASLEPETVITGHGRAMQGHEMRKALHLLADRFDEIAVPRSGRYVGDANEAETDGMYRQP